MNILFGDSGRCPYALPVRIQTIGQPDVLSVDPKGGLGLDHAPIPRRSRLVSRKVAQTPTFPATRPILSKPRHVLSRPCRTRRVPAHCQRQLRGSAASEQDVSTPHGARWGKPPAQRSHSCQLTLAWRGERVCQRCTLQHRLWGRVSVRTCSASSRPPKLELIQNPHGRWKSRSEGHPCIAQKGHKGELINDGPVGSGVSM
jgi:hypothetical protein